MSGWRKLALLAGACLIASVSLAQQPEPYRVRVGDVLRVSVYNYERLDWEAEVGRDGVLAVRGLIPGKVAGKTLAELQKEMTKAYCRMFGLQQPNIAVMVVCACRRKNSGSDAYNCSGKLQSEQRSSYNRFEGVRRARLEE